MLSGVIFRARHVMLTMGLLAAFSCNASASPTTLTVQDPRPVAKAIQELENRYGWQITYEDPPYSHYSDITDVRDTDWPGVPVRSAAQLQSMGNTRTLVPKGGGLTFTLPSADPDELAAVEALVKSYNESHHGFKFAVVQGAGLLHVVPRQARGLSGNLEPVKPVLDTVITIEPKERTSEALLEEVLKKVSIARDTHVDFGTVPGNMLSLTKTSIGGSGKTARSILEQWMLERGAGLTWWIFYIPDDKDYLFDITQMSPPKNIIFLPRPSPAGKP
ncbi:MAG: hypothetical protein ACREDR_36905 [Blastocatellia bacterium]